MTSAKMEHLQNDITLLLCKTYGSIMQNQICEPHGLINMYEGQQGVWVGAGLTPHENVVLCYESKTEEMGQ
jgi:hypothetical protein